MKKTIHLFLVVVFLTTLFVACNNDDDDDVVIITVDDAAEYVAASLALATYGAVSNMNYVSDQIVELIDCGESESNSRTATETNSSGDITVNFTISENYSLSCVEGEETITYDFTADQTTTSDPLDTDHNITGSWVVSGAESSSSVLTYNGSYSRGGNWTYNNEDNHVDNITTSFVYSNVKANKDDGVIFEGTSTFTTQGTSTIYEPYSYEGTVVFQSNNVCVMTFSTGEQYEVNLNTGDVTPL
ncbi:MAG: hypothetical protein OHK0053_27280 [Microscillaceae bacterium]